MDSWTFDYSEFENYALPGTVQTASEQDSARLSSHSQLLSKITQKYLARQDQRTAGQHLVNTVQRDGKSFTEGFYALPREGQVEIRDALGKDTLGQFFAMAGEDNSEFFHSRLLALGQKLESKDPLLSQTLYTALIQESGAAPFADQARDRLKVLQGQGNLGDQAEVLTAHFMDQFLDPSLWVGMGVGIGLFRSVSAKVLNAFARPSFTAKAAAYTVGFAAEVPGFTLASRGVQHLQGVELNPLGTDLALNGLGLFFLKAGGAAGYASLGRIRRASVLPQSTRKILEKTAPALAMYGGINLGHGAQVAFGLRDFHSWGAMLMESGATLAHFGLISRTMQAWIPTKTPVGLPEYQVRSGASRLTELFQAAENRLTQALQNTLKGYEVQIWTTPEGLKFPNIVRMETTAPSSFPPPPDLGGAARARSRRSDFPNRRTRFESGTNAVRPIKDPLKMTQVIESLRFLNEDIGNYMKLRGPDNQWPSELTKWVAEAKNTLRIIRNEVLEYKAEDPAVEILGEISRELELLDTLNQYIQKAIEINGKSVPDHLASTVQGFLETYRYFIDGGLFKFISGESNAGEVLLLSQRVRKKLLQAFQIQMNGDVPAYNPKNIRDGIRVSALLHFRIQEAERINGYLTRYFMLPMQGKTWSEWGPHTFRWAVEFRRLIKLQLEEAKLDPKQGELVPHLEAALAESQKLVDLVAVLIQGRHRNPGAVHPNVVNHYLGRAINQYIQFSRTGDLLPLEEIARMASTSRKAITRPEEARDRY